MNGSSSIWSIAIHGGAGADPKRWTHEQIQLRMEGLHAALQVGVSSLESGGEAMDVVEAVVRALEDHPHFNAGRGAVWNAEGNCMLDASIMDGHQMLCGSVASVQRVKNPISLARRVISDSAHVFLVGDGAEKFAEQLGVALVEPDYFRTDEQRRSWNRWKERDVTNKTSWNQNPINVDDPLFYLGTVGCVVLDSHGNLAAGTSTGGLLGKRWGRIGDSPIIGAGNYAKNATCAISCTGVGELFIRHAIAMRVSLQMELGGKSLEEAASEAIDSILPKDSGGLIAVDHRGHIAMPFNTPGMARAAARSDGYRMAALGKEESP